MSWISGILSRIENTHVPRPTEGNVVDFRGGLDKLYRAMTQVRDEQRLAAEQRAAFIEAWSAAEQDYTAAMAKNAAMMRDLATRMYRLQMEWAQVSEQAGVTVVVTPPEHLSNGGPPLEDGR